VRNADSVHVDRGLILKVDCAIGLVCDEARAFAAIADEQAEDNS
jgi:hypothetical protein